MSQDILVKVGADISNFSREMKKTTQTLTDFGKDSQKSGLTLGKLAVAVGGVALAAKGLSMIKDSVSNAFGRIDAMEQFERVMTTMTGSSEEAKSVLDEVNETVKGTAYGLDIGARAVQDFVTSNMDVDKATETFASWGDAVAFYGDGSNETLSSVSDALAKMTAKGKVQMDTMNRLTERGIPAMQIYADATGQSVEAVAEQMQKGELDAESFTDVMNDALKNGTANFEGIEGAAKEAGASWGASFDNMQAAVTRGVVNIIQKIDEMLVSNGLPDMRTMVADFGRKFEQVLNKAADVIPSIVEKIKEVKSALEPWMPLIKGVAVAAVSFVSVIAAVNTLKNAFMMARTAVMIFNTTLLANPIALIIAAIIGLAFIVYQYWDEIKEYTTIAWTAIKDFFVGIWEWIKDTFNNAIEWIESLTDGKFGDYFKLVKGYMEMVWGIIQDVWEFIKGTFTNALKFLKSLVTGDFQGMRKSISNQMENARKTLSNIWDKIKTFFGKILSNIWTTVKNKFTDIVDSVREKMNDAKQKVEEGWNKAQEFLENIDLMQIGKDIIQGLIDGIGSMGGAVWTAAKNIAGKVKDSITSFLGVASPARELIKIGKWTGEGFAIGIESMQRQVARASDMLAEAAIIDNPSISLSYATPAGVRSSLSSAVSGTVDVNTSENNQLLAEIRNELRQQRQMIIELDGREVGRAVSPTVNEELKRERDTAVRTGGRRRIY